MLARTLKESFRGNLDYHYHENRRVNLISAWLQFSLTLKNLYIVPAFYERFVDLSYDRNFKRKDTAVSRKVVGRNAHATIPKGNMGYDQYTVRNDWSCRTYFCCFPLVLANICQWPPVPFFQISLKNSALKATHKTFRDCRVHFFRQPFSK